MKYSKQFLNIKYAVQLQYFKGFGGKATVPPLVPKIRVCLAPIRCTCILFCHIVIIGTYVLNKKNTTKKYFT